MKKELKIEVKGVTKAFQNKKKAAQRVLNEVNLNIYQGEFICLLGPSGCGKTTLLNLLAGFEKPSTGQIIIDGRQVLGPHPKHITLFQNYGLFPWRDVLKNIEYGLEVAGIPADERRHRAMEYIRMVGLENFINHHPAELSGGMQQRVALARALAVDPDIIFMDEPFAALDAITRIKMQDEIERIWLEKHKTVVFVTHDIDEAVYLADKVVVMTPHPGKISNIINIELGRPRNRNHWDFIKYRDQIFMEFSLQKDSSIEYEI